MAKPDSALAFDPISACIEAFAAGDFLIVLDDASRENEGDLIIAAAHLTPTRAAFMIRHTSGYLCAPMSPARAAALELPMMVPPKANEDPNGTAYTITVDATPVAVIPEDAAAGRSGVRTTTGISAVDRARTCNVLASAGATAEMLRRPGHVVPLVARKGGVRERKGHTEAGWELARLAGISPEVAVIGELVEGEADGVDGRHSRADGPTSQSQATGMMRAQECLEFGRRWNIKCCTIEDLVKYLEQLDHEAMT